MAALPYMQFYVADYLADTMHLTTEEHGAYMLLIMNYWQTGKPIPKKRLACVARMSNDRWNSVEDTLYEFFTEDERGCWKHTRIEQELSKVRAKSNQAKEAGRASAAKRAAIKAAEKQENSNGRSNSVQLKLNHTDTDTDTDTDIKKTSEKKFTDDDMKTAEFIFQKILELNPKHKPPNMDKWANMIRLMREQDKRTHEEICSLFTWANQDDFWKTNILSPEKLRKQWDSLVIKRGQGKTERKSSNEDFDSKVYRGTPLEEIEWLNAGNN
jgi:uncharacterized protein YdaU (DUF1376 family)